MMTMKIISISALIVIIQLLSGCSSPPSIDYRPPTSGPLATLNLHAPAIQTSAANTEVDFQIFRLQSDCSVESRGWVKLKPTNHSISVQIPGGEPLFLLLDFFQSDLVLARNARGEVKYAIEPVAGKEYTVEYKGSQPRLSVDFWEGPADATKKIKGIQPEEWRERNGQVVYRGELKCSR